MYFLFVCVCTYVCTAMSLWRSENDSKQSILSLQYVGPGDGTDIVSLAGKHLH